VNTGVRATGATDGPEPLRLRAPRSEDGVHAVAKAKNAASITTARRRCI
jgi:hypothetical protein